MSREGFTDWFDHSDEFTLFISWGDHGSVSSGSYEEMKAKYENAIKSSGRVPTMRIVCDGVTIRSLSGEWVSPDEWKYRRNIQKEPA